MEFAFGMFTGMMLWPWWGLGIFFLLCLVDAVLVENDSAGFGTFLILVGTGALVWLAGGHNPFMLAWTHAGDILKFFIAYFMAGALWSVARWYLYLLKVRDNMKANGLTKRGRDTYARNNQAKIVSWIGHWPFSMIGTFFGDFLTRIVTNIYRVLSNLYESIANSVFKDFEVKD